MIFSPQSVQIYQILSPGKPVTAKAIADTLHILPNAVYRAIYPLAEAGLVRVKAGYPAAYELVYGEEALKRAGDYLRGEVADELGLGVGAVAERVLQGQDVFMAMTGVEVGLAHTSVDFMVSGLEVPAETILTYKQAVDRGVLVRALVQQRQETRDEMYANWRAIGVDVRHTARVLPARMFVVDHQVSFYTSYNPLERQELVGQKIVSNVLATLLGELFEAEWRTALVID